MDLKSQRSSSHPEKPRTVAAAVALMWLATVLNLLTIGVELAAGRLSKEAIGRSVRANDPSASSTDVDAFFTVVLVFGFTVGLIGAGLWAWMAWKNGAGRTWARVLTTVFGVVQVLSIAIGSFTPDVTSASLGVGIVYLACIVGILILLWTPASSSYYATTARLRRAM